MRITITEDTLTIEDQGPVLGLPVEELPENLRAFGLVMALAWAMSRISETAEQACGTKGAELVH